MWFFAGLIPISDVIKKRLAVVEKWVGLCAIYYVECVHLVIDGVAHLEVEPLIVMTGIYVRRNQ